MKSLNWEINKDKIPLTTSLSNDIHALYPGKAVVNFFMTKNRRLTVRKIVPVCVSASVLQSYGGWVRDAEVDHETERENSESEIVGENSVSDLVHPPFWNFLSRYCREFLRYFDLNVKISSFGPPTLYKHTISLQELTITRSDTV